MGEENGEIVLYQTQDGQTKIQVKLAQDTVWLTQLQMAELFQRDRSVITKHIKNIFDEGELEEKSNVQILHIANSDKPVTYYNLDVAISVGYRVKSLRGTQFRKWALQILKEYLLKGFAMNDDLLKQAGGGSYWKELLERIRDIRSSEKVFYRQVLDLYATSADYDPHAPDSQLFFKMVQNKIHYAAHGHTAAEIVFARADAALPFMGLTAFQGDRPTKGEIDNAKNYLDEQELATLNRMVSAFFDLAELRAMKHQPMYMKDWLAEVDDFAQRYGQGVLVGAGKVSHQQALEKAEEEYEKYRQKTLADPSPAELDFLNSIKAAQKQLEHPDAL
ncbi:MAG: RhuM family protein [Pseudoflavonifractor sp.]